MKYGFIVRRERKLPTEKNTSLGKESVNAYLSSTVLQKCVWNGFRKDPNEGSSHTVTLP